MQQPLLILAVFVQCWMARCAETFRDERGDVAEKVVIVAAFVALAIAVGAIITNKVTSAANNITMQ